MGRFLADLGSCLIFIAVIPFFETLFRFKAQHHHPLARQLPFNKQRIVIHGEQFNTFQPRGRFNTGLFIKLLGFSVFNVDRRNQIATHAVSLLLFRHFDWNSSRMMAKFSRNAICSSSDLSGKRT